MIDPTNNDCASWAYTALCAYVDRANSSGNDALDLQDLLSDLMHFCDTQGLSFDDILRRARSHYAAETEGPEAQPKADPSFAKNH